jgi:hypothetical protein
MAYSKAKLKSSSDKAAPYFRSFCIGKLSDRYMPIQALLYVLFPKNPSRSGALCDILYFFYGEEMLASHPTPKLEGHPLLAVCNCLFSIFATALHIWRLSPPSTT